MLFNKQNRILNWSLWAIFLGLIAYMKLFYHELWKDEWQAWFVAKDKGIGEILSFLYYEGHPALWYLYLKIFTIFSGIIDAVTLISVAHLVTVGASLYFLFIKFRLPLLFKVLFALSYFLFFEYGIINRGYFLVILFVFWAAYLLRQENYSKKELGIILFLLCQTEVYGVFMAIALGGYIFVKEKWTFISFKNKNFVWLASGLLVFILSVFPRTSGHVAKTSSKSLDFVNKLLTAFQGNLSNTYMIGSTSDTSTYGWTWIGLLASLFCAFALWLVYKKSLALTVSGGLFLVMMMAFSSMFFLGGVRQWGMGFVFLIALLEIRDLDLIKEKLLVGILSFFCIFAFIHGYKAVAEDIKIPFTNAQKAGIFIKEKVPAKVPVVAINKFEATPVIGYAGRKFYELPSGTEFSYFKWVDKIYLPSETELKLFGKYKGVGGIILLSPKPLDGDRFPSAQLWQKYDEINYKKENYYIYTLVVK